MFKPLVSAGKNRGIDRATLPFYLERKGWNTGAGMLMRKRGALDRRRHIG